MSKNNFTIFDADKTRYLMGIRLYQSGCVEIGRDGMFYVDSYRVLPVIIFTKYGIFRKIAFLKTYYSGLID